MPKVTWQWPDWSLKEHLFPKATFFVLDKAARGSIRGMQRVQKTLPAHKVEREGCKPLAPTLERRPHFWSRTQRAPGRLLKQWCGLRCVPQEDMLNLCRRNTAAHGEETAMQGWRLRLGCGRHKSECQGWPATGPFNNLAFGLPASRTAGGHMSSESVAFVQAALETDVSRHHLTDLGA